MKAALAERFHHFEYATEISADYQRLQIRAEDAVGMAAAPNDVRPILIAKDFDACATNIVTFLHDTDCSTMDHKAEGFSLDRLAFLFGQTDRRSWFEIWSKVSDWHDVAL